MDLDSKSELDEPYFSCFVPDNLISGTNMAVDIKSALVFPCARRAVDSPT